MPLFFFLPLLAALPAALAAAAPVAAPVAAGTAAGVGAGVGGGTLAGALGGAGAAGAAAGTAAAAAPAAAPVAGALGGAGAATGAGTATGASAGTAAGTAGISEALASAFPGAGLGGAAGSPEAATLGSLGSIPELGLAEGVVVQQAPNVLGGLGATGQIIPGGTAAVPFSGPGAGGLQAGLGAGAFPGSNLQAVGSAVGNALDLARTGRGIQSALAPPPAQEPPKTVSVQTAQRAQPMQQAQLPGAPNPGVLMALERIAAQRTRARGGIVRAF